MLRRREATEFAKRNDEGDETHGQRAETALGGLVNAPTQNQGEYQIRNHHLKKLHTGEVTHRPNGSKPRNRSIAGSMKLIEPNCGPANRSGCTVLEESSGEAVRLCPDVTLRLTICETPDYQSAARAERKSLPFLYVFLGKIHGQVRHNDTSNRKLFQQRTMSIFSVLFEAKNFTVSLPFCTVCLPFCTGFGHIFRHGLHGLTRRQNCTVSAPIIDLRVVQFRRSHAEQCTAFHRNAP
jgi:hypothetical protein